MHEIGLMQEVLAIAERHLPPQSAQRITRIRLRVGPLSGVVPDALMFAFDSLAPGTPAEGAKLDIEGAPVLCYCAACDREFSHNRIEYACPLCHELSGDIRGGTEFDLISMEVSDDV